MPVSDDSVHHTQYTFDYLRTDEDVVDQGGKSCEKWIYKLDYGYHSMTSDVRQKKIRFKCLFYADLDFVMYDIAGLGV